MIISYINAIICLHINSFYIHFSSLKIFYELFYILGVS